MANVSYWQQTHNPVVATSELPKTAQLVVIGGGIVGCTAALCAAQSGARVVLLEREFPAAGATGRNGGFLGLGTAEDYPGAIERLGHAAAHAIWLLTLENRALFRRIQSEEGLDCDYREPGIVSLALSAEEIEACHRTVAARQQDGFPGEVLDRAALQLLIHTPLGPDVHGAIFTPECGLLHSTRLVHSLALAAQRHGVQICRATATSIEEHDGAVHIQTDQGPVSADTVVIGLNAWTGDLLPELVSVITPVRGQVLAYEAQPRVFEVGMGTDVTPTGEYWQQTLDGSIVLGGCRAVAPGADVGVRTGGVTPEVQTALEGVFPRLFPELHGLRVGSRWSGLMGFTPDYVPIADCAPGMERVWFAGGFCGHGMPFGMRLGELLAESALAGTTAPALAPLRRARPTLPA